jgi:hypothetical protein
VRRRAGWAGLSLSRIISGVGGQWLGLASIYCLSDRGKSLLDSGRLPGLTEVTPGDGRAHQAKRISPRGIPRRLGPHPGTSRGTALHPRCTPDAPEWAQLDDHSADKEQGKLVDSTRTWRRAFSPEKEYSQYGLYSMNRKVPSHVKGSGPDPRKTRTQEQEQTHRA